MVPSIQDHRGGARDNMVASIHSRTRGNTFGKSRTRCPARGTTMKVLGSLASPNNLRADSTGWYVGTEAKAGELSTPWPIALFD